MEKPYLSVIIPAYNEADRISPTLIDIDKHLKTVDYSYEILVVSDGSKDDTPHIVERMTHIIPHLRFIHNKENHGKGWVTKQGMLEAKGQYRIFMDSDNATTIDQFEQMRPFFEEGYDVVIGSRAIQGARLDPPQGFLRRVLGKGGNIIIQFVAVWGIKDTQCGFKCFSEKATKAIFPLLKIERWAFDVETLALARKMKFRIKEVPVHWVNDTRSKVKLSAFLQVFVEVFKIRWWLISGKYNL